MTDSASELESDASSIDGSSAIRNLATGIDSETLQRRLERLLRENGTLHSELEGAKIKIRSLTSENRDLRAASVTIQQKAEQEEEFISNTLLKKIQSLKKEKESLAINFEQEEESITNELQRKLNQLRSEKIELESAREREQECQVSSRVTLWCLSLLWLHLNFLLVFEGEQADATDRETGKRRRFQATYFRADAT